ncbi:transposase [sulfur-oxidizing endosymbiont of Gigantopelta aegis]|uniref:transposase n=1 Tax=sulfur-oxidizing endosymbiont of Gigantopelta aegis TaxID=2794934 RepID=UPI001BE47E8F|nr:transposase [sulfur-oxidizing endosymbiont of Gigantopelta aegis]
MKRKPTDIHIDPYLFEFFVYQKIHHEIDRSRLYCNDSVSYCDQHLDEALQELSDTWAKTTGNIIDEFTRISPIVWTHTLFTGRYSFKTSKGNIDVEEMAKILETHVKQHFWSEE